MGDRSVIFAGLAAGALVLAVAAFFALRSDAPVVDPVSVAAPRKKRCKVHNLHRAAKNGRVRAFLDWWEYNGDFDLQIPSTGGVRYDDAREPDGQRWLFASGRTRPGPIVTRAESGDEAPHVHDAANDVHPVRQLTAGGAVALIYLGNESDPVVRGEALQRMNRVADAAEAFGLQSGRSFPDVDLPHIQDPQWRKFPLAIRPVA